MTRKTSNISQASVVRTIKAAKAAGMEVKSFRVEPDGSIVINGDIAQKPQPVVDTSTRGYL